LLDLDARDFNFWAKEARKKLVNDKIEKLYLERAAMGASSNEFDMLAQSLKMQIHKIEGTAAEIYRGTWDNLREKKRG